MANDWQAAHPQDDPKKADVTFGEYLKLGGDHSKLGDVKNSDYLGKKILKIKARWNRRGVTRALEAAGKNPEDLFQDALVRMVKSLQQEHPTLASVTDVTLPIETFEAYFQQHVNFALQTHNEALHAQMRWADTQSLDDPEHPVGLGRYGRPYDGAGLNEEDVAAVWTKFGASLEPGGRLKNVFEYLVNPEGLQVPLETQGDMARHLKLTDKQFSEAKTDLKKRLMERLGSNLPDRNES